MEWYYWVLLIIAISMIIYFVFGFVVHSYIFKRVKEIDTLYPFLSEYKDKIHQGASELEKQQKEEVSITSFDNKKLHGYYFDNLQDKCVILFHGYHSHGFYDFGGIFKEYYKLGFKILIVDQRAHGKSDGKYATCGILERYDALFWARYIDGRFNGKVNIIIEGGSMGASTVMLASSFDLPKTVKGIIADCGFTSAYDIVSYTVKNKYHLPLFPIMSAINIAAKIKTGHYLNEVSTVTELKKCKVPICLIHGTKDSIVPYEMTLSNYESVSTKKYKVIVEGADHGGSFFKENERCRKELYEFLKEI